MTVFQFTSEWPSKKEFDWFELAHIYMKCLNFLKFREIDKCDLFSYTIEIKYILYVNTTLNIPLILQ